MTKPIEITESTATGLSLQEALERLLWIKGELDSRNALYEEYDRLVLELKDKGFDLAVIGDQVVSLIDNFAGGVNTSFKACGVKRFDIRIESTEKHEKRLTKQRKETL